MNNFNSRKWISQSYSSKGHKVTSLLKDFQASFLEKNILNQNSMAGACGNRTHPARL